MKRCNINLSFKPPPLRLGAKIQGGCETKGGCKAPKRPTLNTPMVRARTRTCIVEHYFCHFSSLWVIPRLPQYMPCFCRKSSHPNIHTYMYIMLSRKRAACIACYSRASASGVPICPFPILPRASYLSSQLFLSTTLAHNLGGGRPPLPSKTSTRNVWIQP